MRDRDQSRDLGQAKGIRWGIHLKDTDKLIGTCGIQNLNIESLRTEIGYELSRKFWTRFNERGSVCHNRLWI
jgi:ribosomal-protein-alanine N-acetyltransferase